MRYGRVKTNNRSSPINKAGKLNNLPAFLFVVSEKLFSPCNNKISVAISVINLR